MSETVSSKRIVAKKPLEFDVTTNKPAFLDEGEYRDPEVSVSGATEETNEFATEAEEIGLQTPAINAVKSQILRMADGGQAVIDVVLDVSDEKGVEYYEIRLSKV